MNELISAIRNGELDNVRQLIGSGNLSPQYGYTLLCDGIRNGNKQIIELLLQKIIDGQSEIYRKVSQLNEVEIAFTSLHIACDEGNNECVLLLMRHGADVNAKMRGNVTPLHVATKRERLETVKILLDHGADVDAQNKNDETPLRLAAQRLNGSIIDCILKYNPDVNSKSNMEALSFLLDYDEVCNREPSKKSMIESLSRYGFTINPEMVGDYAVLHKALAAGFPTLVKDFLKVCTNFGPVFEHCNDYGYTLLHNACIYDAIDVFEFLLDRGANINCKGRLTPICVAVLYSRKDFVKLLLNRGVSVDDHDQHGNTILQLAARKYNLDVVKIILKHRPDLNNPSNRKCIRTAVVYSRSKEFIQTLFDYGFVVEPNNDTDYDFLENAIRYNHLDIFKVVYKNSCKDITKKFERKKGFTLLHVAAKNGRFEDSLVERLLGLGIDVNAKDRQSGQTPLMYLIINIVKCLETKSLPESPCKEISYEEQSIEFVRKLLGYGANPNSRDKKGKTALHYAASSSVGMEQTVKLLLSYGAIVNLRSRLGIIPVMYASQKDNKSLENLLLRFGGLSGFNFKNDDDRHFLNIVAAKENLREYFEIPLKLGADINSIGEDNSTILQFACGNKRLVSCVVEYGHDISLAMVQRFVRGNEELLQKHVVKLKLAGFSKFDNIEIVYDDELTAMSKQCLRELTIMKNEKIPDTAVSLRYILTDDTTRLAEYAKNQDIVRYIESEECKAKFPQYANVLKGFLWRGIAKRNLLVGGTKLFRYYCSRLPDLPDICIKRILRHMGDDLRSFVRRSLRMFSIDVEDGEERDLLLDGVVRFGNWNAKRIILEADEDPNACLYYTEDSDYPVYEDLDEDYSDESGLSSDDWWWWTWHR